MVERFWKYGRLKLFALRLPRHITRRSARAVRRAVFEAYKMTRKTKQSGDLVAETMTGMRSEKIICSYIIARKRSMVNNDKKSVKLTN